MRSSIRTTAKIAVCLIILACLAAPGSAGAASRARTRETAGASRPGRAEAYSLKDIMASPKEFLEREVLFYARFATTADLFKQVDTRFNAGSHVNIAVWPDKATLWTAEGRKDVLPTLYIAKNESALLAALRQIKKYELVAFTGLVLNAYAGYPWILVTKIERTDNPSDRLGEQVMEHMRSGAESLAANAGGAAARHFEQALRFGLPAEYRSEAHKQLAQAYLLDNRLDLARDQLRLATEVKHNDPVPHLALADVCLRMGDAEEALSHAAAALDLSGKYPQAYGIKGEALSLLGDHAAAFTELNTAAGTPGITPREKAVISLRRARIYARSERPADAARLYAAISDPGEELSGDPDVHNEIGLFYEELFLQSGEVKYLDSAEDAFGEAAALATLNPSFLYNQAEVEFRRRKLTETPDMRKTLETLEKINRIDPDYPPARLLLGRVLFHQGKTAEAEQIYQSVAPHLDGNSTALLALAEAYIELGRFDDALSAVQSARDAQPWNRRLQALGSRIEAAAAEQMQLAAPAESDKYYSAEHGTADETFNELPDEPAAVESAEAAPYAAPASPAVRSDGFIRLGLLTDTVADIASSNAYASVPPVLGIAEPPVLFAGNTVRIPPPFTFEPDTSPVIIANLRPQAVAGGGQVVRNANLYKRRPGNGRRPAEIIDRDPAAPYPGDAAAMAAPNIRNAPSLPRAEVRLPSSSQGVGMSTDYAP